MKKLTSKQINIAIGKIYSYDKILYGQIKDELLKYRSIIAALEEVNDEIVKAYLIQQKGMVENDLLRKGIREYYPNFPKMEK